MTLADADPPTRQDAPAGDVLVEERPRSRRGAPSGRVAFGWVDEASVARASNAPRDLIAAGSPYVTVDADLLARAPRRSPLRPGVLLPAAIIAGLVAGYSATTILWPLTAVAPKIEAMQVEPVPAAAATLPWPAEGAAAVSVEGFGAPLASGDAELPIASITKVVTALLVLDQRPLALGEQGPEYRFTGADNIRYWSYRARGESALDVPVGGTLTEYQMLEGMLIGSANNYADRLASDLWPNDAVFARAAADWLDAHGVPGVTIAEPTGFDARNAATAAALVPLAEKALANPVIAEIVAKPVVSLPGAGEVENTNDLLADPGVIGIKTGSLDEFNLLSAKEIVVGGTPVRLVASVLGQPDDDARDAVSRALYAQLEQELQTEPSVPARTTVGVVKTAWGERVEVVTDADASVVLWNGAAGTVTTDLSLGDSRDAGEVVGTLSVAAPLDDDSVDVVLDGDIDPPSVWWRLTHPLELFGLSG